MQVSLKIGSSLRKHTHSPAKKKNNKKSEHPFSYKNLRNEFMFCYYLLEEIENRGTPNGQRHLAAVGFNSLPFWITQNSVRCTHSKWFVFVSAFPLSRRNKASLVAQLPGLLKMAQIKHKKTYPSCYPSALKTHKEPVAEAQLFSARYPASKGKPREQDMHVCG